MCGSFNEVGRKMKSLLLELKEESKWTEYLNHKIEKGHLSKKELEELTDYIDEKKYLLIVDKILAGEGFSIPNKKFVNKVGTTKKRVVYSFEDDEVKVLKLMSFLLYRYDDSQPQGCYSFRKGYGAYRAISTLAHTKGIEQMWVYKLDIHNYFNSINIDILLSIVAEVMKDDKELFCFLKQLLTVDRAIFEGETIEEKRGVMAGTPISPFFANLFLKKVDAYFVDLGIPYARYSDDIILFGKTEEELLKYKNKMQEFLSEYDLTINEDKQMIWRPYEAWEFLGISFQNHEIDLSVITKDKMKGKIRRKAHAIRRWMIRKEANEERAMKAMINSFNGKFFEHSNTKDLTWSKWFFPLVTKADGFQEIDRYLQQYIRYIPTGKHNKKNYEVDYEDLKSLGYRSLVNEYYHFKKEKKGELL